MCRIFLNARSAVRATGCPHAIVWLCTIALLALDLSLYHAGRSWTPFHYESLSPLLALGASTKGWRWGSAGAASLLFGTTSVLFFCFGLTWRLAAESWVFLGGTVLMTLVWIAPAVIGAWQNRRVPLAFLAMLSALLCGDKLLSHDMLSSFYMPHFLKLNAGGQASPSANPVYAALKSRLAPGRGGVLIVFEALGVPQDLADIDRLRRDYADFSFTTPQFEGGSTVAAEVRYLCGVNGTVSDYSSCLPHRLRSRAVHGNSLAYFSRNLIYPEMGFVEAFGRHELSGLTECRFAYAAICDNALWNLLERNVEKSACSDFNYVLSIDSHFPYTKYSDHVDGLYTDLRLLLERMRLLKQAFPSCLIMIAGDHPPPLSTGFDNKHVLIVTSEK